MSVGEALTGIGAPVTQEPRLRVLQFQRLPKQGILLEVQHPHAEVEASTPVFVDLAQLVGAERDALDRRASRTVRGDRVFRRPSDTSLSRSSVIQVSSHNLLNICVCVCHSGYSLIGC